MTNVFGKRQIHKNKPKTKKRDTAKKERKELVSRIAKVVTLRQNKSNVDDWNAKECKVFLQHKKQKTDPAMPTGVGKLRDRCKQTSSRISPTCSPRASDDKEEVSEKEDNVAAPPVMEANS